MSHLDIDRVLAAVAGQATAAEQSHLDQCAPCRTEVEAWRMRVAELRELEANAVEATEMHNLQVLFRVFGPTPAGNSWMARLVRSSEPAPAPVRGALTVTFEAYRAGPYEIVLQIGPSEVEGRFDLQGQVEAEAGETPVGAQVVLTSEGGHVGRAHLDDFGEFRLTGVPEGPCRLAWSIGDGRIDLDPLFVGERADGEHD